MLLFPNMAEKDLQVSGYLLSLAVDDNIACESFVATSSDDSCVAIVMLLQRDRK
jgi:hypothetical protein